MLANADLISKLRQSSEHFCKHQRPCTVQRWMNRTTVFVTVSHGLGLAAKTGTSCTVKRLKRTPFHGLLQIQSKTQS